MNATKIVEFLRLMLVRFLILVAIQLAPLGAAADHLIVAVRGGEPGPYWRRLAQWHFQLALMLEMN